MKRIPAGDSPNPTAISQASSTAAPPQPGKSAPPTTSLPVRRAGQPRRPATPQPPAPKPPREPFKLPQFRLPERRAPQAVVEPVDALPKLPLYMLGAFLLALAIIGFGISVVLSQNRFEFLSPELQNAVREYVDNYQEVILGMAIMIVGAALAGIVARSVLADRLAGLSLPIPKLLRDPIAIASLGIGLACMALLWWHLIGQQYSHLDIVLFFLGLILIGVAVHRLDVNPPPSTLRITRFDWLVAAGLAVVSGILNSIDLTRWNFAWIGDEGAFFGEARTYAEGNPWNFFNLSAVYQTHPALDSIYQGIFLKIFGTNVFAWRFSEVIVLSLSTLVVYFLGVALFGRLQGVVAATIVGSSHYLMAFTRIAYNNLHIVFYASLVFLMLALAWRTQRAIYVYLTGVAMGFCLYTFQAAILTWPMVALLLLIIFFRRPSWAQVIAGALMFAAFILVVTPGLLTTPLQHLIDVAIQNSRREVALTDPGLVARISIVQSWLSWWLNYQWHHHYIGGPLVDWITGILLAAGLAIGLLRIGHRGERLAVVWFAVGLVMLSISNYVPGPSLTRLLFLLPPVALLAGIAASKLERLLRASTRLPQYASWGIVLVPVLIFIPALNMNQLLVVSPQDVFVTRQVMAMKAVQEHPDYVVVEVGTQPDFNTIEMMRIYPWLSSRYRYVNLDEMEQPYPEGPAGKLPIFMVDQESQAIVQQVSEKLPPYYQLTTDYDPLGSYKTWLFIPDPNATVDIPTTEGPKLATPELVTEIHVEGRGGATAETRDVAVDSQGNIYVATNVEGVIRKYDPGGKLLTSWGNVDSDGQVFQELFGIAIGPDDLIYALDAGAASVLRFDTDGKQLGEPMGGAGYYPRGISVTPDGDILVADTGGSRIVRFSPEGQAVAEIGQPGDGEGQFAEPTDAVVAPKGDMFVMDARNGRIQHLGLNGAFVNQWTVAQTPTARDSGHIAIDQHGRLFVTAPATHEIVVYNADGQTLTRWPQNDVSEAPAGIFVDKDDNVYVTYPLSDLVRKYRLGQ